MSPSAPDVLGRLTQEQLQSSLPGQDYLTQYAYDLVGNRLEKTTTDATGQLTDTLSNYDARDELRSDTVKVNTVLDHTITYGYDVNGSLITETDSRGNSRTYIHDLHNRLADTTIDGANVHTEAIYRYNESGLRVSEDIITTVGNGPPTTSSTRLLLDDNNPTAYAQVIEEYSPDNILKASYAYGREAILQYRGGLLSYYLHDGHSGVRLLANAAARITDLYRYDGYGLLLFASGSTVNVIRYRDERFDPLLDEYNFRARSYIPEAGRFHAMDPFEGRLQSPISLHRYLYANLDPIDNRDPSGRETLGMVLVGIGALMTAVAFLNYGLKQLAMAHALQESVSNQQRTGTYAEMYLRNRRLYKWTGLAALGSQWVGVGITGTTSRVGHFGVGFSDRLRQGLIRGNRLVFQDIYWQFETYDSQGMQGIEDAANRGGGITPEQLDGWRKIEEGRLTPGPIGDKKIWDGNRDLLRYEQEIVLQKGIYDPDPDVFNYLGQTYMPSMIPDGIGFQAAVPNGKLADFKDRWLWVDKFMLPDYQRFEPTAEMQDMMEFYARRAGFLR